ncbi:MAG: DUF1611 domain-containing protein [Deltaproteobacteria bacterium]|nr:DUF1611 domain-containing protein [Deltaproteobacteria bacterium]
MSSFPEGNAIIYCQGAFATANGKTAHGLVRRTRRYRVLSVVDSLCAGNDAGTVLDGKARDIPIYGELDMAVDEVRSRGNPPTHLVIGLAPDGGRLSPEARSDVIKAINFGLNVDCGLHDFLSEDADIAQLAAQKGIVLRDIRKPPHRKDLHFFTGKIEEVTSLKVAVLGTDSAIGKRTTTWILLDGLREAGYEAELIGTGQTAWMQGARYGIILDSLVNDFVAGEVEHAVWTAWKETQPQVIVIEGQGSLMNPAYPGGFEILAAGRPDIVVLQHAPGRKEYDGFPGYPIHPLETQIRAIELLSGKPVVAIAINHENLDKNKMAEVCQGISKETGLPACEPLLNGAGPLVAALKPYLDGKIPPRSPL